MNDEDTTGLRSILAAHVLVGDVVVAPTHMSTVTRIEVSRSQRSLELFFDKGPSWAVEVTKRILVKAKLHKENEKEWLASPDQQSELLDLRAMWRPWRSR